MSALAVIVDILQKKADWCTRCLICDGTPEVQALGTNLEFFLCKPCTKKHLDVLLDNNYILYGGESAQRRLMAIVEGKMV